MARIIICDDHPFVLMGTKSYISGLGHEICEICSNGISAYNMILKHRPDIAVLDISMPGLNGLEILERIRNNRIPTKVILLTMHNEMSIFNRAKDLKVNGYVLKEFSIEVLGECIEAVLQGKTWFSRELSENLHLDDNATDGNVLDKLSTVEKRIVESIAKQHTSKEIASMLFISEKTVENHRGRIMKKLQLPSEKNALLVWALTNVNSLK